MILDTNDPNSSLILAQDTGLWESFWDTFVFSIPHPWNCAAERITWKRVSLVTQTIKHLSANAGDTGSIPGSGRFPAEGDGNPLPIFLPGKFHGQRSLEGYSPQGRRESDSTEHTQSLNRFIVSPFTFSLLLWQIHALCTGEGHRMLLYPGVIEVHR